MKSVRCVTAALFLASSFAAPHAEAVSSGAGGSSMGPCSGCHQGGATPQVQFRVNGAAAASAHVQPGQTLTVIFAVLPPNSTQQGAGFKVDSPLFPLTSGESGVAIRNSYEAHHTATKTSGGQRNDFRFLVRIPPTQACGASHMLTGWGSAVNRNGSTAGDGNATATLAVIVDCPPPPTPTPTPTPPPLPEADATQILRVWLQTSNYYRMNPKNFAIKNARRQDRDWIFDLVLLNCATSEPIDVWRVDSATKQVTRQAAVGTFIKP